jgi:2-dehydro-3-deoxygluconokinase
VELEGPDLVTFGETMVRLTNPAVGSLRHATTLQVGIGGAESNVAIGVTRLGGQAAWMGRVGADQFGMLVLTQIRGEGVDVDAATIDDEAPTGLMIKSTRAVGVVEVVYYRRGSAASTLLPEHLDHDLISRARVLHVTGITPALGSSARQTVFAAIETARAAGTLVCFDPNYRSALWSSDEAARCFRQLAVESDVVLAGLDEAELMYGRAEPATLARSIRDGGTREAVVKLGAGGATGIVDEAEVTVAAPVVEVLDPVGAGDAFAAGYIAGLLRDMTASGRLDLACRTAAIAIATEGDWEGFPTSSELDGSNEAGDVRR